jgi:hypothetical protein
VESSIIHFVHSHNLKDGIKSHLTLMHSLCLDCFIPSPGTGCNTVHGMLHHVHIVLVQFEFAVGCCTSQCNIQ